MLLGRSSDFRPSGRPQRARADRPHLRSRPLYRSATVDRLLEADVFVKHENHEPTGAFRVRGGVSLVSRQTAGERGRGVIAASTGNHGQSVAYAARLLSTNDSACSCRYAPRRSSARPARSTGLPTAGRSPSPTSSREGPTLTSPSFRRGALARSRSSRTHRQTTGILPGRRSGQDRVRARARAGNDQRRRSLRHERRRQ